VAAAPATRHPRRPEGQWQIALTMAFRGGSGCL
jgi:hypothetical protein